MKNLIRFLPVMCFVLPVSAYAKSSVHQAVIRAELFPKNSDHYTSAAIGIDGRKGLVDLTLQPNMAPCAEGMMCAQVMPEPLSYTLENATTEIDECGIIRTRAVLDQRPFDGVYISLVAANNTNNTCPTFVALPALDVTVEQQYFDPFKGTTITQVDAFEATDVAMINPGSKDVEFTGKVMSARYQNKKLALKLSYSGGCQKHAFDLKWGECKDVKLLNSIISECAVTILHTEGAGDACEALITKTHTLDLSGLAQAYIINLNGTRVLIH